MISSILYLAVPLFSAVALASETQPSGEQFIWEFVNCVQSTGYQTQQAWGYNPGTLPGLRTGPDFIHQINGGSSYYYEGQTTAWSDDAGNEHEAYIFSNANSNNDGPQGIQVSAEGTGM